MTITLGAHASKFSALLLLVLPIACSESTPWEAPEPGYYDDNNPIEISGVGVRVEGALTGLEIATGSGVIDNDSDQLEYGDENYTLTNLNGGVPAPGDSFIYSDSAGATVQIFPELFAGEYNYVLPVQFSYEVGGVEYATIGFVGIQTETQHVPVSGTAIYTGDAYGAAANISAEFGYENGSSIIFVDFSAGIADVMLNQFTVFVNESVIGDVPFDTIQITSMTVSGNTFTGGQLTTILNGSTVNFTGANTDSDSSGMFFGFDDGSAIPDEVAGVTYAIGGAGGLIFQFIAD
ncbi:MAG: hypothetical protein JKY31_05320 [Rhodobacteraceae bacterium]|nr:hypothetical protein [Paracoccaceae bacterium]